MRVSYSPPSVNQFDIIFRPTNVSYSGGGLNDIKVFKPYYRGGSLFGILGSIVRRSIPFLKNFIFPEAGNFARNMANDMHGNIPLRTNIKKNLIRSAKNIGKNILHGGRRMKRTLCWSERPSSICESFLGFMSAKKHLQTVGVLTFSPHKQTEALVAKKTQLKKEKKTLLY